MADPDARAARLTLVRNAARGDANALAQIMAAHDGDMARVCMVICGDPDLAREAVQAAWVTAWRRLGSLRDPDRLRPWLMSVAANEVRQQLRSASRRSRYEQLAASPLEVPGAEPDPDLLELGTAVAKLSVDDRRLLALRYVADLTSSEIALELGGSPSSVRGRLARLLARLREEMS